MPTYSFECGECEAQQSIIRSMKDAPRELECERCGATMHRIFSVNLGNTEYSKPLHSDSLAISPEQRAEHKKHFPDVEIDSENRPVFKNFKQHDNYLKKTGFYKVPKKSKK